MELKILRDDKDLPLPSYAHEHDAGMDVYSAVTHTLNPGEIKAIPTGIRLAIPPGYEVQVRPRSGLALKYGIGLVNSPGTIDSQYRGPVNIIAINHGKEPYEIRRGDRIAQLVLKKVEFADLVEVQQLDDTVRSTGGYGSTGR